MRERWVSEKEQKLEKENKELREAFIETMDIVWKYVDPPMPIHLWERYDRIKNDQKSDSS